MWEIERKYEMIEDLELPNPAGLLGFDAIGPRDGVGRVCVGAGAGESQELGDDAEQSEHLRELVTKAMVHTVAERHMSAGRSGYVENIGMVESPQVSIRSCQPGIS